MGHAVFFDSQKDVVNFATSFGAVISSVLGPFIQLKINGFYDFKAAHPCNSLNEMTSITLAHMPPLVFDAFIRQPARGGTQGVNQRLVTFAAFFGFRNGGNHEIH